MDTNKLIYDLLYTRDMCSVCGIVVVLYLLIDYFMAVGVTVYYLTKTILILLFRVAQNQALHWKARTPVDKPMA